MRRSAASSVRMCLSISLRRVVLAVVGTWAAWSIATLLWQPLMNDPVWERHQSGMQYAVSKSVCFTSMQISTVLGTREVPSSLDGLFESRLLEVPDSRDALQVSVAGGWPWRCVSADYVLVVGVTGREPASERSVGGVLLPGISRAATFGPSQLPIRPHVRGLVGNALLVCGLSMIMKRTSHALVRRHRRRRHRCSGCGYPMTGLSRSLECPECGAQAEVACAGSTAPALPSPCGTSGSSGRSTSRATGTCSRPT